MKKILLALFVLLSIASEAQTGAYDFLNARKRFTVKNYYITDIKNDTFNFYSAGSRYLPTAKAVYDFVTGRISLIPGGGSLNTFRFDSSYTPLGGMRAPNSYVYKSIRIRRNNITVNPVEFGDSALYWNISVPDPIDTSLLSSSYTRLQRFLDSIVKRMKYTDTAAAFSPYVRTPGGTSGNMVRWIDSRTIGNSSILYDNGTNAGATSTFLAPSMKSASSPHSFTFRFDANNGIGPLFSDGSVIQFMNLSNFHYMQSVNTPANGLFIGTYPGQSFINFKINGRISYDTLADIGQRHFFAGSGRFTDSLFGLTLSNLADSSDVVATTKWVKRQKFLNSLSFTPSDFNSSSDIISIDYINGQKATAAQPGFMTATQAAKLDSNQYFKAGEGIEVYIVDDSTTGFRLKYDTIAVASFGAGSASSGDTSAFSTSAVYGSFYNSGSDTIIVTRMQIGLQGTSPNITIDVFWNDSLNVSAGATKLVTAGSVATNIYTGTSVTSFNNTKIPPGNWVWVKSTSVATKPTYLTATLIGYKKRVTP